MSITRAVTAVLAAADWSDVFAVLDSLPQDDVDAVAEGLWDHAWHLLGAGEPAEARVVALLGELVERVARVGSDATVEAFLELGAVEAGLEEVERMAAEEGPRWFAVRHDAGLLHTARYALTGDVPDLDAAVEALVDATGASDAGDRADATEALASVLWQRFTATTQRADLDRGVAAVHESRSAHAHGVRGNLLKERYDWFGDAADLDAAIAAYRVAVALAEPGSPDHVGFGGNLAMAHADRYLRTGAGADLQGRRPGRRRPGRSAPRPARRGAEPAGGRRGRPVADRDAGAGRRRAASLRARPPRRSRAAGERPAHPLAPHR